MSSHRIALATDSTCDIPADLRKKYEIHVVPQTIIWGADELKDGIDITPQSFYKRLGSDPVHPKTSQPTPHEYTEFLKKIKAETGAEEVVCFALSNQLSGTHSSAVQAAAAVDFKVHVVDSLAVSLGLGFQVLEAARAREAGADAAGMVAAGSKLQKQMATYLAVDTLDYLHKGGRIGGAARLVGTALQLKPILTVDHAVGRIEPGERTRTRRKAIDRMVELYFNAMKSQKVHLGVLHCNCPEDAETLAKRVEAEHKPIEMFVADVTAVIGVHVGPGTLAMIGYYES